MKLALFLLAITIIATGLPIYVMVKKSFKQAFLKKKKTKEEAIESLRKKGMLSKSTYYNSKLEEVTIKSIDGYKLKGYIIEKFKGSNRYVILVHGYSCNHFSAIPFVEMFEKEKFNILLVDQRNHGESEGEYPTYGVMESKDMNRWIELLRRRVGDNLFLGMHGQSMGAATSLITAGNNELVKFVIDDCGFSTGKKSILYRINRYWYAPSRFIYGILKISIKSRAKFSIDESRPIDAICKRKNLYILFVHGTRDTSVPSIMAEEMYKKRNNKNDILYLVKDAEHMICYKKDKKRYEELVHEIIERAEKNNEK